MAFALLFIGLILIIASARGTLSDLGTLIKGDFTGPNNFFYWMLAIGIIGAFGYSQKGAAFSRAFMTLILLSMVLSNKGFFAKFMEAIETVGPSDAVGSGVGNTISPGPANQSGNATKAGDKQSEVDKSLADAQKIAQGLQGVLGGAGGGGGFNVKSASGLVSAVGKVASFFGGLF